MNKYKFNAENYKEAFILIAKELMKSKTLSRKKIERILKNNPKDGNQIFSRDKLIAGLQLVYEEKLLPELDEQIYLKLISKIKLKPMRTESGVTTVTVLTKPFACPGKCVFCPNDVRMPKSYIANEPGAQRALMNRFSPYLQTYNRLIALKNIGHPTEKIELLILGGTWSYYPEKYRIWFISECFRAMNEFGESKDPMKTFKKGTVDITEHLQTDFNDQLREKEGKKPYNQMIQTETYKEKFSKFIVTEKYADKTVELLWENLYQLQKENAAGKCRNVGLVLETRPDVIDEAEVLRLRKLGATKIQLGVQTLDDKISDLNKRGEHKTHTAKAFRLLRSGGFKIHAHIMPNLHGATPEKDLAVFKELFESEDYKPDELKIYPTSIIKNTELYELYKKGEYQPYTTQQLIELVSACLAEVPEYCRVTRIIRDIPSTEIEAGNKTTNLREVVEFYMKKNGLADKNIRNREIGNKKVTLDDLQLEQIVYKTRETTEYFLQYVTDAREIAGFLRLSIPNSKENVITKELYDCAIIREVHVYGPSLEIKKDSKGEAQHLGLGSKLIDAAKEIVKEHNFNKLAVISAIGTREYYEKRGFKLNENYQIYSYGKISS